MKDIPAIGRWTMRCLLVIGAVVGGCLEKEGVAVPCIIGLIASFYFLNDDD